MFTFSFSDSCPFSIDKQLYYVKYHGIIMYTLKVNILLHLLTFTYTYYNTNVSQVAEGLELRASNLKVASSIPGRYTWRCVLGQGTSPHLPRGECPCTYCKSLWKRASAKWLIVNVNIQYQSKVWTHFPRIIVYLAYTHYTVDCYTT